MTLLNFRIFFAILPILFFFFSACENAEKIDDYRSGITVRIKKTDPDPVNHALNLLGLRESDLNRSNHQEAGYHLVSRIPLIDHVAQSPFYLHGWADDTSGKIQQNAQRGLFDLLSQLIGTLNGGVTYTPPDGNKAAAASGLLKAYIQLYRHNGLTPDNKALDAIRQAGFSEAFDRQLGQLLSAVTAASDLVQTAVAALTPEERFYLSARPERYFFPAGRRFNFLTAPTHVPDDVAFLTRKIDFVSLYTAGLVLSQGVDTFTTYIRELPQHETSVHFFEDAKRRVGIVLDLPSPVGRLAVYGQGDNYIDGHGALVIDLGGNDRYTGAVSVGSRMPGRVALAIDIGGDDVYNRGTRRYGQGFGCLAVGMMVDISGNDKYVAGNMAQGSGMYGIGVLADLQGQDTYRMGLMGQGFGLFGIGVLLDAGGKDRYLVNGMGQGTGSTMGLGSLVDVKGNDKYLADRQKRRGLLVADNWSHAQGSGLSIRYPEWEKHLSYYGGIGFLSDGSGDDFYFSSDGNCMGSSYFMSIGALVDHGGNDRYMPGNGYGMGFAVHFSQGILIDRGGNDTYYGNTLTGGVGSDRSIAVLADYAGDDTYGPSEEYVKGLIGSIEDPEGASPKNKDEIYRQMAQSSYASALKPKALGILIDYGGSDRYFASPSEKGESFGGVTPPVAPQNWSHAMLFDLGGNDFYYKKGRKNNHYFHYLAHGLCYDTEYPDAAGFGKKSLPVPKHRSMTAEKARALAKSPVIIDDLVDLTNKDLFVRYIAKGNVIQKGVAFIPDLIDLLSISDDQEFNRDLIEILDTLIMNGELKRSHGKQMETLLYATDPFVKIFAARTLGAQNIKEAFPALIMAVSDKNDSVRFHVIRALSKADSSRAVEVLIDLAASDPSAHCRRAAVRSLGELAEKMSTGDSTANVMLRAALLKAVAEADEAVRTYAATGLQYYGKAPAVVSTLRERTRDGSVYVRRMAAKSLILNGVKEGIPVLIETLKFKSIDTFEFYDHEIAKDLAFYTGIDFPGDQRYAYSTWHKWWQDADGSVNLKQNLAIMRSIEKAFAAPSEEDGITIFERLVQEYPSNVVVRRRYLRYADDWINFRLLTRRILTPEIFERCLRLQKITTNLEPESAQRWDRLAYYYARLSRYAEAAAALESAIALEPGNKAFKNARKQYRRQIKEES